MKLVREFGIGLAIAVIAFSLFPVPAFAVSWNHQYVGAHLYVRHGSVPVVIYDSLVKDCATTGDSASDPCLLTLNLNHRDAGRYERWCETSLPAAVAGSVITNYQDQVVANCGGPATWSLLVVVTLCTSDTCAVYATATSRVYFEVTIQLA